jgi:hypothetical protein
VTLLAETIIAKRQAGKISAEDHRSQAKAICVISLGKLGLVSDEFAGRATVHPLPQPRVRFEIVKPLSDVLVHLPIIPRHKSHGLHK